MCRRRGLGREIKAAEAQLKDLELTVDYVEKDRAAFAHIDDRELDERKKFARRGVWSVCEALVGRRWRAAHTSAAVVPCVFF